MSLVVMHMKSGSMEEAIEEFKNRRLGVYNSDTEQMVRDARGAERVAKDHTGRWLFELLQNSDDAEATEVRIVIDEDTIYVADKGNGLKPETVSAICGTDFSDKTTGTIGRKGIGFKSVYEVSQNPQVLTVDGEGIEFNPAKAKNWLKEHNLNDEYIPYQWIPFFISWEDIARKDPKLREFKGYKTVVRLCAVAPENSQKVKQLLMKWPPHALFAFRHVRQINAPGLDAPGLDIVLKPGDGVWSLCDSRGQIPVEWRVAKHTERHLPSDLLEALGKDERRAIKKDGVSFLIAAPLENNHVIPITDYLPVHVFYPTEQTGPVRLLLHAEFLVKSDRTALMPVDAKSFNEWVAKELACHVCRFVNDAHSPEAPSKHASLLVPFADRTSHPVAENLWRRIADEAKESLRLADVEGCQRLSLEEARLISVSVRPDLARTLLEATSVRGRLLHPAFDEDKEARKALRELGCKEIRDQDLMTVIAGNADLLATETQWMWACWEWLAAWVDKEPYGEEHNKRIEHARSLPVVPIHGSVVKASDLADRIVTWKPDSDVGNLPDWLPLTFVEDWFRDRIQNEATQKSPVKKLSEELGIAEPGAYVIQRAVGQAIEQYWKDKQGEPGRFLHFILEQDWYETADASPSLRRCPVPLSQSVQGETWAEAGNAYFGREWGNDLLAMLYDGVAAIAWAGSHGSAPIDNDNRRRVLEWLGVADCPRVLTADSCDAVEAEKRRVRPLVKFNFVLRADALYLDRVSAGSLPPENSKLLLTVLCNNWGSYYRSKSAILVEHTPRSRTYYDHIPAAWWNNLLSECIPPMRSNGTAPCPLKHCWLPDKRTERAIGGLLPVIDLDAFENDKDVVRDWLINVVGLRTRIEQLKVKEWEELLSNSIPKKAPNECLVSDDRLRDKVTGWYNACLETVAEEENVLEKAFASCPLLCRKGDVWQYVADEPRYLADDNDFATAFAKDVWLFHIRANLANNAVKYFGVLSLSKSVEVNTTLGEPQSPLTGELNVRFSESLPYVWAWRSSKIKQAADKSSVRLKGFKVLVVPALNASLSLDGVRHEVERHRHVTDDTIYLHKDHVNEAELAQALAKALRATQDADFYENLFRCADDRQRKKKLLSKGISDAEVERCLREYSGPSDEDAPEEKPENPDTDKSITPGPSVTSGDEIPPGGHPPNDKPDPGPDEMPKPPDGGEKTFRLKDSNTVEYVFGGHPERGGGPGSGGGGGSVGTGEKGLSLTEMQKAELERAGRVIAARKLKEMGYSVEHMSQNNPGFDLLAKMGGDELRVEVKAHGGRATVVDLTRREYEEYLLSQHKGYRWELWNVEHISENDSAPTHIAPYYQIPDDALDTRIFRVDLKKCQMANGGECKNGDSSLPVDRQVETGKM